MVLAKLSWQNQIVDPVVIFSHAFSLRAVHSIAREVSPVLPRVVLRRRLLQFALVRSLQGKKWETEYCRSPGHRGSPSVDRRPVWRGCVWRDFFSRRTAARGETLYRKEESEVDHYFVTRYVTIEVFPIWREEESEMHGRPETAREERPIGLCQVLRSLAKMPSFLPHLPTLSKCKTQMQNHWISQFELFGKLVKCKPQLQNHRRCIHTHT
jgi:hypothetical protein